LREFWITVTMARPEGKRKFVHSMIAGYTCYWLILPYKELLYLYYLKVVPDFTLIDYGNLSAFDEAVGAVVLLIALPLLTAK